MSTFTKTRTNSLFGIRSLTSIAMLSAISVILMIFEFPLWFAPEFYKIDLSEIPVLIGGFALGPVAAIIIETVKILLNLLINGTITAGIGELANFIIGCAFAVPSAIIYKKMKSRKGAVLGLTLGTFTLVLAGSLLNAYLLLPTYALAFHMPMDGLVAMGTVVNPAITNLSTFILFAVAPFNLLKGLIVSIITMFLYKKMSPIIKKF